MLNIITHRNTSLMVEFVVMCTQRRCMWQYTHHWHFVCFSSARLLNETDYGAVFLLLVLLRGCCQFPVFVLRSYKILQLPVLLQIPLCWQLYLMLAKNQGESSRHSWIWNILSQSLNDLAINGFGSPSECFCRLLPDISSRIFLHAL